MRILEVIKDKNKIVGYNVTDGKTTKQLSKAKVVELVQNKQIENATLQLWQGNYIVRVKDNVTKSNNTTNADKNKSITGTSIPYNGMTIADSIVSAIKANNSQELNCMDAINMLNNTDAGIPLKVKITDYNDWKQCIYMGSRYDDDRRDTIFRFFDGSAITGTFDFSKRFISNNEKIKFKFNDNDATETAFLINYMKKGPFNLKGDTQEKVEEAKPVERPKYKKLVDPLYYGFINKTVNGQIECKYVGSCKAESFDDAANKLEKQLAIHLAGYNGITIREMTKIKLNKLKKLPCSKLIDCGNGEELAKQVYFTKLKIQQGLVKVEETIFIAQREDKNIKIN